MMKNRNTLSEDELRQRVDGFSMNHSDKNSDKKDNKGFIIVDQPIYPTHSADYDEGTNNK
jgi:hypothetical protein